MESTKYKKRIADNLLREQLEAAGMVLIQGPKWCGKTTTAEQVAQSIIYMDDPQRTRGYLMMAETNPAILLEGTTPRLVDEWQLAPQLWDAARFVVDRRAGTGHFIFTGSAVPADKSLLSHTGTGRFAWLTMRPMSLWESGDSNGNISLRNLFSGQKEAVATPNHTLEELAFLLCRGGWPGALNLSTQAALKQSENYVNAICQSDISRVDNVNRDSAFTRKLLRSYARHQGGQVPVSTIHADLSSSDYHAMSENTIVSYLSALRKIFVVEDMPAWNPNLRSKSAIRTSDTRYFVDPSVAVASLGIGPKDLMNDLNTFGLLFETLAVRDLRVYGDALGGDVFHFRDSNGLECDAVLHLHNGSYGLVEIKLGGDTLIEEGVKTLKRLSEKIDTNRMGAPSFLMVLTAVGDYAYCRKDGVMVVPIGCLRD